MRLFCGPKTGNALIHVPTERADPAYIVVKVHLPVRDYIEAGLFLVMNRNLRRIVVRLFVGCFLERDANIPAQQLPPVPVRPRIRPNHGGWKNGVCDLTHIQTMLLLEFTYVRRRVTTANRAVNILTTREKNLRGPY